MGARADGRDDLELRPLGFELGFTRYAEGSVLARCGATWVLCNASVEDRVPPHCEAEGKGWVTAEYAMLPRATHTRGEREGIKGPKGRTQEIQRLVGRAMRAAVDLSKLAGFTIRVDCDVLQADGGTRTTAISGSWVALALATRRLVSERFIPADPMVQGVAATSVGLVGGRLLVDLDYAEDSSADVDMNLVLGGDGRWIELQATAERAAFSDDQLATMLAAGRGALARIFELQKAALAKP